MGRKNHYWDPELSVRDEAGAWTSACRNCGMLERGGWFGRDRTVYWVKQWLTPQQGLLGIRPLIYIDAPPDAPELDVAFPGMEPTRMPECPKSRDGWLV